MVNWVKLLYVLVIALLYVPMVFLGANVFFPKYTGTDSYFRGYEDCNMKYVIPEVKTPEQQKMAEAQQQQITQCNAAQRIAEQQWNDARNEYNGLKYAGITAFNLVILLIVLFASLADTVIMGIFFGTVAAAFGATISYWEYARTKVGFILMLVTFFVVIWFVNRRAKSLFDAKSKKR